MNVSRSVTLSLLLPALLSGCVMASGVLKEHRWSAGATSIERSSDDPERFELTYHGRKEQSAESAIEQWHHEARKQCRSTLYDTSSIGLKDFIIPKAYGAYVDDLYVYYPVPEGWPQVVALVEC